MSRIEVITSVERRRRWSASDKARLVAAMEEPGAIVTEVARKGGVDASLLYRWRRQLAALTDAERQARCRAARASGTPAVRIRRPLDHRSRAKCWCDAISELTTLQGHFAAWLEALPDNLQDSATAEALQAICDIDLTELQAIVPPRG